jgi:HK97 family phage major capsid protein
MSSETDRRIEELLGEIRKANAILEDSGDDGARKAAALDAQADIAADLSAADEQRESATAEAHRKTIDAQLDALRKLMADNRRDSKATAVGGIQPPLTDGSEGRRRAKPTSQPHAFMKAAFEDYRAGEFLAAILDKKGVGWDGDLDPALIARGKATLAAFADWGGLPIMSKAGLGVGYVEGDTFQKATLGATGATGGYVLPNNLVDTVLKPATQKAVYQNLVTVINGVAVRGVDQPYRTTAAQRAAFIDWGTTKTNVNEAYGTYSANLGTLAIIYDIGKQYARFSAGAAEQDVMDEITRGMILGENYYIAVGAGTGTVGTGDPTSGVYTSLVAAGGVYSTAFSSASNSTLVGSFAEALTVGSRALAIRAREPQAWVTDATTFWTAIGQGSDTAGFWVSPAGGPTGFTRTQSGGLSFWGVPVYYDANLGTNAATKIAIGGEWDKLKLYRGMEFRIDTSDVAGTRWDLNLIGFRGEEEIGFHAGSAVATGAMQLITAVIP